MNIESKMKAALTTIWLIMPTLTFAQNNGVGGGNLCREEIEKHRAQIEAWIERDEARDLDFSKAMVKGWTYDDPAPAKSYKRVMLKVLRPKNVIVTCYDDVQTLDAIARKYNRISETIDIGGGCINYEDGTGQARIDCYAKTINEEALRVKRDKDTDGNYRLVHHEYASIAGVEKRMGVIHSDFSISNQLTEFQHDEVIKVLGSKKSEYGCRDGDSFSPQSIKQRIDCIYERETKALELDLLIARDWDDGRRGLAFCSDGKKNFYIYFKIYVLEEKIGPFSSEKPSFNYLYYSDSAGPWNGDYDRYLKRVVPGIIDIIMMGWARSEGKLVGKTWELFTDEDSHNPSEINLRQSIRNEMVFKFGDDRLNWWASCILE